MNEARQYLMQTSLSVLRLKDADSWLRGHEQMVKSGFDDGIGIILASDASSDCY